MWQNGLLSLQICYTILSLGYSNMLQSDFLKYAVSKSGRKKTWVGSKKSRLVGTSLVVQWFRMLHFKRGFRLGDPGWELTSHGTEATRLKCHTY